MKKIKKEYGITLIALVITIIILLILAGVAINALTQTGLFENAKQAKNITENAQGEENVILESYENKVNKIAIEISGSRETNTYKVEKIGEKIGTESIVIDFNKYDTIYIVIKDGVFNEIYTSLIPIYAIENGKYVIQGDWGSDGRYASIYIDVNKSSVNISSVSTDGKACTENSKIIVYGIKY